MSNSLEKLQSLRQTVSARTVLPAKRYEQKKSKLLERLQKAPVIAALALLAAYSPVKAHQGNVETPTQDNVFTTLPDSPLKNAYAHVENNFTDETPGSRLARLFHLRLEQNNVGNLEVSDGAINQAAIDQANAVLDSLRAQGITNPTWRDVENLRGNRQLAQNLAAIEETIGARGTAAYTRVVFGEAPEIEKQAVSEMTYKQHTFQEGWGPFEMATPVEDLSGETLQKEFIEGQNILEKIEEEVKEEISEQDVLEGEITNTPSPEPTLPANPEDVLTSESNPEQGSGWFSGTRRRLESLTNTTRKVWPFTLGAVLASGAYATYPKNRSPKSKDKNTRTPQNQQPTRTRQSLRSPEAQLRASLKEDRAKTRQLRREVDKLGRTQTRRPNWRTRLRMLFGR